MRFLAKRLKVAGSNLAFVNKVSFLSLSADILCFKYLSRLDLGQEKKEYFHWRKQNQITIHLGWDYWRRDKERNLEIIII